MSSAANKSTNIIEYVIEMTTLILTLSNFVAGLLNRLVQRQPLLGGIFSFTDKTRNDFFGSGFIMKNYF